MRLNPARFNKHIANLGQKLEWRRAYACACVNPNSGAPDPKHALCGGKGRVWDAPVRSVCGVTQQVVTPEMAALGIWDSGDMTLTIPSDSPLWAGAGKFDRILLLNSTDIFSQPLTRGAPNEKLIFTVESFQRCFWLNAQGQIVEGGIPVVSDLGVLSWPNGGEPPAGKTYSLTGTRYDEYFILNSLPSDRNEHQGAKLPKKASLRKWDLWARQA